MDRLPYLFVHLVKVLHAHPQLQLFLKEALVLLPPVHHRGKPVDFVDPQLFNQLLYLIVEVVWLDDGSGGFEILLKDFERLEDLSFQQKLGSIDILHIAVDLLDNDVGNFPVEDGASRKTDDLVVSPRELCGRTDHAIGG